MTSQPVRLEPSTHKRLVTLKKRLGMTFDEIVEELANSYACIGEIEEIGEKWYALFEDAFRNNRKVQTMWILQWPDPVNSYYYQKGPLEPGGRKHRPPILSLFRQSRSHVTRILAYLPTEVIAYHIREHLEDLTDGQLKLHIASIP